MPDVMNEEFNALAAEFVLGTLDAGERGHAHVLRDTDEGFGAKVKEWERRLGELHLMVEPVEPDWQVWEKVKTKIGGFESKPFFKPPAAETIAKSEPAPEPAPEPEPPSPAPLPPASPVSGAPEAKPPEPASAAVGSPAPESPTPELPTPGSPPPESPTLGAPIPASPEPRPIEPVLAPPPARGPEPARPSPVALASREPAPAVAAAALADDAARWRRSVRQWQTLALLMTVVAVVMAGFVAALRNFPDRLPAGLRPQTQAAAAIPSGTPTARRPAPPGSEFDE
jgi:hypothetical protein